LFRFLPVRIPQRPVTERFSRLQAPKPGPDGGTRLLRSLPVLTDSTVHRFKKAFPFVIPKDSPFRSGQQRLPLENRMQFGNGKRKRRTLQFPLEECQWDVRRIPRLQVPAKKAVNRFTFLLCQRRDPHLSARPLERRVFSPNVRQHPAKARVTKILACPVTRIRPHDPPLPVGFIL